MKNEWDLFVVVREQIAAGAPESSFDILEPPLWTIFSRRPARVRGSDGTVYDLGPDFPDIMYEFIKFDIGTHLTHAPPVYRLFFNPSRHDPAAVRPPFPEVPGAGLRIPLDSHDALRSFLDLLPTAETPPPAPDDDPDNNGEDGSH